jgi:hypothetical protein
MLINDERTRNVYENKEKDDNWPDTKHDISTQLRDILRKSTRIFQKPLARLSLFERWGTNPSLQNVETRDRGGTLRCSTPKRVYSVGKFLDLFGWGPILFHCWEAP